jgi:hypothetical protein
MLDKQINDAVTELPHIVARKLDLRGGWFSGHAGIVGRFCETPIVVAGSLIPVARRTRAGIIDPGYS